MPVIGEINYNDYVDKQQKFLIDEDDKVNDIMSNIENFINNNKEKLSNFEAEIMPKGFLDEACVIYGQPLLFNLAEEINNNINEYLNTIDSFKVDFQVQVERHKGHEARETYRKTMKEYANRKTDFRKKMNIYNADLRHDKQEDRTFKIVYPTAIFNEGSDTVAPTLEFKGGNTAGSKKQTDLQSDFDELSNFYDSYVKRAKELYDQYGNIEKTHNYKYKDHNKFFKSFSGIDEKITNGPDKSDKTSNNKNKNLQNGFAVYKDTLIHTDDDGYCCTTDFFGNKHYVFDKNGNKLTKEKFNELRENGSLLTITALNGEQYFNASKNSIEDIQDNKQYQAAFKATNKVTGENQTLYTKQNKDKTSGTYYMDNEGNMQTVRTQRGNDDSYLYKDSTDMWIYGELSEDFDKNNNNAKVRLRKGVPNRWYEDISRIDNSTNSNKNYTYNNNNKIVQDAVGNALFELDTGKRIPVLGRNENNVQVAVPFNELVKEKSKYTNFTIKTDSGKLDIDPTNIKEG